MIEYNYSIIFIFGVTMQLQKGKELILPDRLQSLKEKFRGTKTVLKLECEKCKKEGTCSSETTRKKYWLCESCLKFENVVLNNLKTIQEIEKIFDIKDNLIFNTIGKNGTDFIAKIAAYYKLTDCENIFSAEAISLIKQVGYYRLSRIINSDFWIQTENENVLEIQALSIDRVLHMYTFIKKEDHFEFLSKEQLEYEKI